MDHVRGRKQQGLLWNIVPPTMNLWRKSNDVHRAQRLAVQAPSNLVWVQRARRCAVHLQGRVRQRPFLL